MTAPARMWSFGPTAALTLFDAGRRHAQVAEVRAGYDEQVAEYRGVVLTAYQEVEDSLSALHDLEIEQRERGRGWCRRPEVALQQTRYQYQMGTCPRTCRSS